MTKYNFNVKGMHCNSCKVIIKENLEELGATNISISLDEKKKLGKVSFEYSGDKSKIVNAIEKEGYKIE